MRTVVQRLLAPLLLILILVQLGAIIGQVSRRHQATADPIGLSVQGGTSPFYSYTTQISSTTAVTAFTVSTQKQYIITDIHAEGGECSTCYNTLVLMNGTTNTPIWAGSWARSDGLPEVQAGRFSSRTGIAIAPGTKLQLKVTNATNPTNVVITGYFARP